MVNTALERTLLPLRAKAAFGQVHRPPSTPRVQPGGRSVRPVPGLAAGFWRTLQSVLGSDPSERLTQLAADAVLARILIDRGVIDEALAGRASVDRDRTGLLFEHVLHARHGVPLEDLLGALAERRAIMGAVG